MATYEIPLSTDRENYSFSVSLDGAEYIFDVVWNSRAQAWFLSVSDADGTAVLDGKKLVTGAPLNRHVHTEGALPGVLELINTTGDGSNPTLTNLGVTFFLLYTEAA